MEVGVGQPVRGGLGEKGHRGKEPAPMSSWGWNILEEEAACAKAGGLLRGAGGERAGEARTPCWPLSELPVTLTLVLPLSALLPLGESSCLCKSVSPKGGCVDTAQSSRPL